MNLRTMSAFRRSAAKARRKHAAGLKPAQGDEGAQPTRDEAAKALLEDLFRRLKAQESGLSTAEAAERLDHYGPNEPGTVSHASPLLEFLRFCTNPLVLILLAASAVSGVLGEILNASIIAAMVVLSVVLNFFQAYRSEKAVRRLREQMAPTATVLRDGQWLDLARQEVVPGDVIRLSAGDLVPADARLLQSRDLHVQEAALTGESMPAEKSATAPPGVDSDNLVFLGTSITSGSATALIYATGRDTAFGDIADRLALRPPETEFDRGARRFGILIMETVFFLVMFILLVNIGMHRNALESLLFAVALAVGLTPEFLPMITTVTLSAGAVRMARKKVIVKHLAAIQNFGSIDVLCTDKTGTLTAGVMTLAQSLDATGELSDRPLVLAYLNSRFETGIKSPLDAAILQRPAPAADDYQKTDEIPFDFERRMLSVVVEKNAVYLLITKGAPETVLAACATVESQGTTVRLSSEARVRSEEVYRSLSVHGFRVLAVACRPVDRREGLTRADERDLTFVGFLTFADPPVESAAEAVAAMNRDGVRVKVLTGDNDLVARHVCSEVNIPTERVVLGDEIDRLGDAALAHVAEECDVFARVSPGQKNRLIRALKSRSHVVGFLGDGINDAPSLHQADVGISVGNASMWPRMPPRSSFWKRTFRFCTVELSRGERRSETSSSIC